MKEEKKFSTGVYCGEYCGRKKTNQNNLSKTSRVAFDVWDVALSNSKTILLFLSNLFTSIDFSRSFRNSMNRSELIDVVCIWENCHPSDEMAEIIQADFSKLMLLNSNLTPL